MITERTNSTQLKEESQTNKKVYRVMLRLFLLAGAVCVSAKMLFTAFPADEEYQLVMSYRLAMGDRMFTEVWDTIQTSGFLCSFLIRIFMAVTGSATGILLYLRACGILLQAGFAFFLYRTVRKQLGSDTAFCLSIAFYCLFTKLIALPEFANMQSWGITILICLFWRALEYDKEDNLIRRNICIALAAPALCFTILSTACVILVPILAVWIAVSFRSRKKDPWLCNLLFLGICVVIGSLYVARLVLSNGSFMGVLKGMANTLSGDSTHMSNENIVGNIKWLTYLQNLLTVLIYMAVTWCAAFGVNSLAALKTGKHNDGSPKIKITNTVWILLSLLITLVKWFFLQEGYDGLKLFIPVLCACGLKETVKRKAFHSAAYLGILCGIGAFLNVLFISNVPLINNLAFLYPSALWGMIVLLQETADRKFGYRVALLAVTVTVIAGTGYTLSSGALGTNVFQLNGIIRNGPAKNCIVSRDVAWIYHQDYLNFESIVPRESNVLIVTDFFRNTSVTSCYLLNDVRISHYSVNSTPTYSDKLEEYWELYPERKPDCIMVNTNAVNMSENDWIYRYLMNDFGYTEYLHTETADYYLR